MGKTTYTDEDLAPILGIGLKPSQIANLENTTARTVNRWARDGKFPLFYIHPGSENRIPIQSFLEFRRQRRIDRGK